MTFLKNKALIITLLASTVSGVAQAQSCKNTLTGQSTCYRTITTGVPFLRISPDARGGSMGDVGIATTADVNDQHWNIAKLAMTDKNMGLSITYTPWLRDLVPDINLAYLSFYKKFGQDNNQAVSASLRYFNLGEINYNDINASSLGTGYPREYAFDAGYSRKLSSNLSIGVAGRYIHSNIINGPSVGVTQNARPGNAASVDLGVFYTKPITGDGDEQKGLFNWGVAITNVGTKISYSDNRRDFIPMNLGVGVSYTYTIDEFNTIMAAIDINKLLVPSPTVNKDSLGNEYLSYPDNVSVASGIFKSFGDSHDGASEEFKELMYGVGVEYGYQNQFFARAGYYYEDKFKGARQFATVGLGFKYNIFKLNFAYLVPSGSGIARNPLSNTLRFSLMFDFDKIAKQKEAKEASGEDE
jgi:hypothetical protein